MTTPTRRLRPLAAATLLGVAALLLPACGSTIPRTLTFQTPAPEVGVPAVDVVNNKGGVKIVADGKYDTVTVTANVHVIEEIPEKDRAAVADEVRLFANMETDGPRPVLRVRSESPRPDAEDHTVDVLITMPALAGAQVRNRGGQVIIEGIAGALQVENTGGGIEVRTPNRIDEPVALVTDKGNVYFQMPLESAGRFELRSADGEATFDSPITAVVDVYSQPGLWRGVVNDGVNPIVMRTEKGEVRAYIMKEPMNYVRFFK
ncbi:MAG: hypothetical protein VYC34_06645 [Planctomycetota bacterium]|nr:hypothetical protein [Planctomycetota bacterium]